jgi:hypothetical protein
MPNKKPTPGEAVAKVIVENLSDPDWEKKEAKAQAEKEARQREALKKLGVLKPSSPEKKK